MKISQKMTNSQIIDTSAKNIGRKLFVSSEYNTKSPHQGLKLIKHSHTRTCQILDRSQDLNETEIPKRSRVLHQMALITQKMTPDFMKGTHILDRVESKDLDFKQNEAESTIVKRTTMYGEHQIIYTNPPVELMPSLWNQIELRQVEFYYLKIRCKGMSVPLQFFMKQEINTNFKIFLSPLNPYPTKFSCDQVFTIKGWKYKYDESKIFNNDYLYLSIVSEADTIMKVKFYFGQIKKSQTYTKMNKSSESIQMDPQILKTEIAEIKKRRRMKLLQMQGGQMKDLVQQNIKHIVDYNEDYQKSQREWRKQQSNIQIQEVIERKRVIEVCEQQRKEINLTQKQVSKAIRFQQSLIQHKKFVKNKICSNWLTSLTLCLLTQKINQVYKHKQEVIKESRLMALHVKRIMKRMHNQLTTTKGLSIFDRCQFDTKMVLTIFCSQIYYKQETHFIKKSLPVLKIRAQVFQFKQHLLLTHSKILKIRNKFKEFIQKYRNFKTTLNIIWNKYFKDQFAIIQQSLKGDLANRYNAWIQGINSNVEYADYVQKQFSIQFSKRQLKKFLNEMSEYSKIIKGMRAQRQQKKQQTRQRDSFASDLKNLRKPRLFIIPGPDDILEFIPLVFQQSIMVLESTLHKSKKQLTSRNLFVVKK
ncbi:hypothetical protein pb186bvf_009090 [Paramecium bursaria]